MRIEKKTFESLKIRNYRLYFIGQSISLPGTWMQTVAQSWLVLKLTGSGTALGLVLALQYLPMLILGPWGGLLVDRFPKRKLLFFTQSAYGIFALILGILVLIGTVQLWMIYIFAFCLGLINTVDNPTRQTFAVEMVSKDKLHNAIVLNSIEINLARVVGPALAGILILSVGIGFCFILNAISFIGVIISLSMMHSKELFPSPLVKKKKGQVIEGLKYVKNSPVIKDTIIMMAIIGTLTYEFSVSLPLLTQSTFHGDAGTFTLLTSSIGIGAVIGGLFIASRKKTGSVTIVTGAFFLGLFVLGASMAQNILMAILLLIGVGFFSIYFNSSGNTTIQLESSPSMRGRVMALWAVASLGSTPIGSPIIGWVGEHMGARYCVALGGVAAIVAALFGAIQLKRGKYLEVQEKEIEETDISVPKI
ncbi:MAG: MFS transporter [Candidatus Paceibacterota bacterium]